MHIKSVGRSRFKETGADELEGARSPVDMTPKKKKKARKTARSTNEPKRYSFSFHAI